MNFFEGKRVFLTGHTGFKGAWLSVMLNQLGANVYGYSLPPEDNSLFIEAGIHQFVDGQFSDIMDRSELHASLVRFQPEIIIHMAAQPLVSEGYKAPVETIETNVVGTAMLLDIARSLSNLETILVVTSDKCYENKDQSHAFVEEDRLGGKDPYSASKAMQELVVATYQSSFFSDNTTPNLISARAGNVIGGGDVCRDRLVPDLLRCVSSSKLLRLRNPQATRPWQHVLEPLSGYLRYIEYSSNAKVERVDTLNFGPKDNSVITVQELVRIFEKYLKEPFDIEEVQGSFDEAKVLKLNISKSEDKIHWEPLLGIEDAVKLTVEFFYSPHKLEMMKAQIASYLNKIYFSETDK